MSSFTADTYQNEYLSEGGGEVNAVVTVTSLGGATAVAGVGAAEVIIVDTSGSMSMPTGKIRAAREATRAAVDSIRDDVAFAVIAGTQDARLVYPGSERLVPASAESRAEAKKAIAGLDADGGTAIGRWLTLADRLFATSPDTIHHAILLTDGQNQSESSEDLERALRSCEGRFQCDCRGVGTDWEVSELRRVASVLLGTVDIIPQPDEMEAGFRAMIDKAMGKGTKDVSLRLWTPQGAEIAFVKQVAPTVEDLTGRAGSVDAQTVDYPTGAWGDESRDYHVCVRVQPREIGDEMLAGRVSLVVDDEPASQALIKAIWTDDEQLSTRINREVAHYSGQAELAEIIQEGLQARKAGDEATATVKLGRAVQIASESGNDATMKLLGGVVDVDDPATGTVRLRRDVEDADEMALDTRSTKTERVRQAPA